MIRNSIFWLFIFVLLLAGTASANSLVAHWKFDEGAGSTADDSSVNNNVGTLYNMDSGDWVAGVDDGTALDFDGSNDYIKVLDHSSMSFGSGSFSIAFWMKAGSSGGAILINGTSGGGYSGKRYYVYLTGGKIAFDIDDNVTKQALLTAVLTDIAGEWHHVVCYRDGAVGNTHICYDGEHIANSSGGFFGNINSPGEDLYIAKSSPDSSGNYFPGQLDDIRLYDYVLSQAEISALAAMPEASSPSPEDVQRNVPVTTDLTWSAGTDAVSHDVYFDTDETSVTSAMRLAGDIDGDGTVALGDIATMAEQWLGSPVEPYADVDDDGDVNLIDFAVVSAEWSDTAGDAFKGNQAGTTYDPGTMAADTIYYWRIDEVNAGTAATGDVWRFRTAGTVQKGPYLFYPGNNTQMTVLWQLDRTVSCTLAWGTDTSYSTGTTTTTEYGSDHQHRYTITGLSPATKYFYRVTSSDGSKVGTFYSAPSASATAAKFLAYGDTRTFPADHNVVCESIVNTFTAASGYQTFLLQVGDWNGSCSSDLYWENEFFNRAYPDILEMQANLPINGCIGNHEWCDGAATYYQKYYPYPYTSGLYWSFDYGPAHIVVVDQYSASYSTGSAQYNWLANDLANSTKEWKFILLHEPGYSAGGHPNNTSVQSYIQPLCETYGVDIVFAGHNHYYARCGRNGVKHLTIGGGGAPLYTPDPGSAYLEAYSKNYHYCKIDINGAQLNCTVVTPGGTVIDSFSLSH